MTGDQFTGCTCAFRNGDKVPLMARWIAGFVEPIFHNISGGIFLSVRSSLIRILADDVSRFDRVLNTILSLGVGMSTFPFPTGLGGPSDPMNPTVAAVNGQWRQLLAAVHDATMEQSTCVMFKSATTEEMGVALVFPDLKKEYLEVVAHRNCTNCISEKCGFVEKSCTDSFLDSYRATFFQPVLALFEVALKKGWGISSSFFNPRISPPELRPRSVSIDEYMKSI